MLLSRPDHPAPYAGLGACAIERGRFQEAVGHYQQALAVRKEYSPGLIGLARAYRLLGDRAAALQHYRLYLARHPDGARAGWARRQISELERK
jgi:tetratricopeptide (TPR) repeat protein